MGRSVVITIDGPSGAGKSTVARKLAGRLKFLFLDTGAMYRAVAFAALRHGVDHQDGPGLAKLCQSLDLHFDTDEDPPHLYLGEEDITDAIRSNQMDLLSSKVSAVKEVREAMTDLQRHMSKGGNLVCEGRDMGTVVFPDARYKFFLTASPDIRALRRYRERLERGESVSANTVSAEMKNRDLQDQNRAIAPLRAADDARVIDSTHISPEEVIESIVAHLDREVSEE
jgi:cytidylate kinase